MDGSMVEVDGGSVDILTVAVFTPFTAAIFFVASFILFFIFFSPPSLFNTTSGICVCTTLLTLDGFTTCGAAGKGRARTDAAILTSEAAAAAARVAEGIGRGSQETGARRARESGLCGAGSTVAAWDRSVGEVKMLLLMLPSSAASTGAAKPAPARCRC